MHVYITHLQATLLEMLISLFFAVIFSFFLAIMFNFFPWIKKLLMPCFVILQNLPMFVLAPFLLACFGWGLFSIVLPTILMLSFPLTLSFSKGLSATPEEYIHFYRLHGAKPLKILLSIRMPFALPHIFSGLKIAAASSATGAVAGEWAGAQKGLGVLMQIFRRQFDFEGVFICLGLVIALSLSCYFLVSALEKILLFGCYGYKKGLLSYLRVSNFFQWVQVKQSKLL